MDLLPNSRGPLGDQLLICLMFCKRKLSESMLYIPVGCAAAKLVTWSSFDFLISLGYVTLSNRIMLLTGLCHRRLQFVWRKNTSCARKFCVCVCMCMCMCKYLSVGVRGWAWMLLPCYERQSLERWRDEAAWRHRRRRPILCRPAYTIEVSKKRKRIPREWRHSTDSERLRFSFYEFPLASCEMRLDYQVGHVTTIGYR